MARQKPSLVGISHMFWAYHICCGHIAYVVGISHMFWSYLICCGHIACCGQCPLGISHMFWAYCICCGHITTYEIYVVGISRRVPPPVSQNAACHAPTFPVDRTICSICSICQLQLDTQELKLANHLKPRPLLINIYKIYCTSTLNSCENFYPMENTF